MTIALRAVICEANIGNVRSVVRAIHEVTVSSAATTTNHRSPMEVVVSGSASEIAGADYLVVPGQGAFGTAARALSEGLDEAILAHIAKGKPYLGICLGMQMLFERSEESPGARGLGVFRGEVRRLRPGVDPHTQTSWPVPHVGWNGVAFGEDPSTTSEATREALPHFYFAHSYVVIPEDRSVVRGTTDYGISFVSVVGRDNVLGVQFHPEKSQREGLRLLSRFFSGSRFFSR